MTFMDRDAPWAARGTAPSTHHEDEGANACGPPFGAEKYERLVALKDKYDPTRLLRSNQNIPPSVAPV